MTDSHHTPELSRAFTRKCLDKFKFLSAYRCELAGVEVDNYGAEVTYKNRTTAVKVTLELRENDIFVYLIRLVDGGIPAYLDAPSRWFYLDNVVKLRSPSTTLPRKRFGEWLTPDDIDHLLSDYADALRRYGEDILRGDFSVFEDLWKQLNHSRPVSDHDDTQLIRSNEELRAQKQRLPAQIAEYYDTYFRELRDQLQRPDLFTGAVPNFLKGYKKVIAIGGRDGLVIAHFPTELEITMSKTGGGEVVMQFPSLLDAKEDHYNFIQFPGSSVNDLATLISGGEDIGLEIPPEQTSWGVRGFNAPQEKIDITTGELAWQSPWTHLVAADLYHLKYWENPERAKKEVAEDIEPYIRSSSHYTRAISVPERAELEDLPEIGEYSSIEEEPQVGFGRNLDLLPQRNRGNEGLRIPVTQYAS